MWLGFGNIFLMCWICEKAAHFHVWPLLPYKRLYVWGSSPKLLNIQARKTTCQNPWQIYISSPDKMWSDKDFPGLEIDWKRHTFDLLHTQSMWFPPGEVGYANSLLHSGPEIPLFPSPRLCLFSLFPILLCFLSNAWLFRWGSICL